MTHRATITPQDLAQLSERAATRLYSWWIPDLGDLVLDMDDGSIYPAGDSDINPCLEKDHGHYVSCLPLLSTSQLIQYLDDHDIYRDPTTGTTHLDGIPADQILDFLWDRCRAHLEYGDDPAPLPDYIHVGVRQ
jgi:hypothetical protein